MRGAAVLASILILAAGPAKADTSWIGPVIDVGGRFLMEAIRQQQRSQAQRPPRYAHPPAVRGTTRGAANASRGRTSTQQREDRAANADIQRKLAQLGYDVGRPSGKWTRQSLHAVREFQASLGHTPTGRLSDDEKVALYQRGTRSPLPASATRDIAPPVQATPVQATPVQTAPVQAVPVQAVPVQAVPVQTTPAPVRDLPQRLPPLNASRGSNIAAVPPPLPGESTLPEPTNALAPLN